jgi:ATP-dependent DNA helicase RecG
LRANLYERVVEFVAKHLPGPFYVDERGQKINLRENVFREVVANIMVHKEYLSGELTKLITEKKRVLTEDSSKPYINGIINLSNLKSYSKNPNISKFFMVINRVEELGSGI